jgi:hypothetical protein
MTALRESQAAGGGPGFRTKAAKDKQSVVMFLGPSTDEPPPGRRIRDLLGLDPVAREFTVVYGSRGEPDGDIAILTRSILQVMIDLASQIEVPAADVAEGHVHRPQRSTEQQRMFPPLIAVSNGTAPSADAYAAVQYRGLWFWIDDRDQQSKHTLSFLMMLFSLTETAATQAAPLVTIPAR